MVYFIPTSAQFYVLDCHFYLHDFLFLHICISIVGGSLRSNISIANGLVIVVLMAKKVIFTYTYIVLSFVYHPNSHESFLYSSLIC